MSDLTRSLDEAEAAANVAGLIVCAPQANELQLDIDSPTPSAEFEKRLADTKALIESAWDRPVTIQRTRSVSGNWHIRVFLPFEVSMQERIMWQAVLGSDPTREYLSAIRTLYDNCPPTLFFEKSDWQRADLNEPANSVLDKLGN